MPGSGSHKLMQFGAVGHSRASASCLCSPNSHTVPGASAFRPPFCRTRNTSHLLPAPQYPKGQSGGIVLFCFTEYNNGVLISACSYSQVRAEQRCDTEVLTLVCTAAHVTQTQQREPSAHTEQRSVRRWGQAEPNAPGWGGGREGVGVRTGLWLHGVVWENQFPIAG